MVQFWQTFWIFLLKLTISSQISATHPNHGHGYTENIPKSSPLHFITIDVLLKPEDHLRVELYQFLGIWGIRIIWGNWTQSFQIMGWIHKKYWNSFNSIFYIQRSCSSLKSIWGWSYTSFTVNRTLGQFRTTEPKYPKSWAVIHRK